MSDDPLLRTALRRAEAPPACLDATHRAALLTAARQTWFRKQRRQRIARWVAWSAAAGLVLGLSAWVFAPDAPLPRGGGDIAAAPRHRQDIAPKPASTLPERETAGAVAFADSAPQAAAIGEYQVGKQESWPESGQKERQDQRKPSVAAAAAPAAPTSPASAAGPPLEAAKAGLPSDLMQGKPPASAPVAMAEQMDRTLGERRERSGATAEPRPGAVLLADARGKKSVAEMAPAAAPAMRPQPMAGNQVLAADKDGARMDSFSSARKSLLQHGALPDPASIRSEDFIAALDGMPKAERDLWRGMAQGLADILRGTRPPAERREALLRISQACATAKQPVLQELSEMARVAAGLSSP